MRSIFYLLLSICGLLPLAQAASPDQPLPAPVTARIEKLRAELPQALATDEAARKTLELLLERALQDDTEATRLAREAREIRGAVPAMRNESLRLERRLTEDAAQAFRDWRSDLPAQAQREELTRRHTEVRSAAEQAVAELEAATGELTATTTRPTELNQLLAQKRTEIDSLNSAAPSSPGPEGQAGVLAFEARRRLAQAQLLQLQAEQDTFPEHRRLLELRQRELQRRVALYERQIDVLEAMLAVRTDAELGALSERLQSERETVATADPALLAAAERNLALGAELAETASWTRQASERARQALRHTASVTEALHNTRARLELGIEDDAVGLILLSERRRLQDADEIASELERTRRELARVQLRLIELDELRDQLDAPEQAIEAALRDVESDTPEEIRRLREGFAALLATRSELLPRIEVAQRDLADNLRQLERALQEQLTVTRRLTTILDRQLLWIPSHEPISLAWLQHQYEAWADLFKISRYVTSARLLGDAALTRWPLVLLSLLLFLALLGLRRGLPARLEALSQPLLRVRTDRYRYTAHALLLTVLGALPWPLLLCMLGWLLQHAGQAGKFSDSLGNSLVELSGGVLLWQALYWLSRERGLGHLHFRWTRNRRGAIRAALPWLGFGLLPLQFLLTLAFIRGQEPAVDAAARVMLLAFCVLGGWLVWRILAPGALWTPRGSANVEPARWRQLLRIAVPALLAGLALIALDGYVLTAGVMLRCLWLSASAVLMVAVMHGLIARWFLLGERRLALKRLEQRREAEAAETGGERSAAVADAIPDIEPEEVTLASVSLQTRRLLRALTVVALASLLLWVWSDVLPALARLDEIALWSYSDVDADGKTISQMVSLRALLVGLALLLLTAIAARNLPGLVEIGLLSRINLDAPTRYAITSISRYVIVIGGVIIGLSLLGVRWGQLQWMAAALTVGLGFGLQEIFANFVSGLIVLFERPYRVGDIITIGEVEGVVTRIRTRATTVLDWDNKEVVVPNKTFITERFVNWTLSDNMTRVVLQVGVAYASDPERVHSLLLSIAESDPRVLHQPPPNCWLMTLGASTLDFELRVFVGEILDRNQVRHALYQRIIRAFREQGIEIAFPQMDLWVRNAPGTGALSEASTRPPAPAATPG